MGKQDKEITFGDKAVGRSFNPSDSMQVDIIKQDIAGLIDDLNELRGKTEDQEVKRLCSVAITELQGAQMWAVKAVTWEKK